MAPAEVEVVPVARDPAVPEPVIRPLSSEDDLDQCVLLQRQVWGDDFRELVPPAVMLVAQKVGGIALGAFAPEGQLLGFVFGITGLRDGRLAHWSHMLAVRDSWRDRGLGRRLKEAQGSSLRDLGVATAYWTFDPLVARNAHLNVHCLGATVVEYVRDMYGQDPTSPTTTVIGSDRFVVAWEIADRRAGAVAETAGAGPVVTLSEESVIELPGASAVLIEIPDDIQTVKQRDPERAREWRRVTRTAFEHYLALGYRIADFRRGMPAMRGRYLLVRPDTGHD